MLTKKIKEKELTSVNLSQFEKLCIQSVYLRLESRILLEEAKKNLLDENPSPAQHGKGPFAYNGLKNTKETIYVGDSPFDKQKGIVIFSGAGISSLETQLGEQTELVTEGKAQRVETISYLTLPSSVSQLQTKEAREQYLRDLSSKILGAGTKKVKVSFNERKKSLEIGSKGGRLLTLSFEEVFNTSGVKEFMCVAKLVCVDCQASNIFEATKAMPKPSLQCSVAKQVEDLLDQIPVKDDLLKKVDIICSNYNTNNVLITKRERTHEIDLHNKVKYFKNALNSCLNNMPVLDPQAQEQYLGVMNTFIADLKSSSLNEKVSLDMVETISKALALDNVPAEPPKKARRTTKGGAA